MLWLPENHGRNAVPIAKPNSQRQIFWVAGVGRLEVLRCAASFCCLPPRCSYDSFTIPNSVLQNIYIYKYVHIYVIYVSIYNYVYTHNYIYIMLMTYDNI